MTTNEQAADTKQEPSVMDRVKEMISPTNKDSTPTEAQAATHKFSRVHIIVNPASGQAGLNLPALNKILKDLEIDWEMFVMRKGGEARDRAKQAIEANATTINK